MLYLSASRLDIGSKLSDLTCLGPPMLGLQASAACLASYIGAEFDSGPSSLQNKYHYLLRYLSQSLRIPILVGKFL